MQHWSLGNLHLEYFKVQMSLFVLPEVLQNVTLNTNVVFYILTLIQDEEGNIKFSSPAVT